MTMPAAAGTGTSRWGGLWERRLKPWLKLWRDKRDILMLLGVLAYFVICIYLVAVANAFADRQNTNTNKPPNERYVAPDPLMDATDDWYKRKLPQSLPDTCVVIAGGLLVLFAVTRGIAACTIVRRALFIVGSLYLGRVPYIMLTNFPAPWRECFTPVDYSSFGYDTWLLFSGKRVDCGDTFYSGHTIVFASCMLIYWHHCRYFIFTIPVLLFNIFGMLTLIFSTYHYTVDVLAAFVFTFLIWWLFRLAIEIDEIGNHRWWGKFIRWIDYNGHTVLEDIEGPKVLMMGATGRGPIHPDADGRLPTHAASSTRLTPPEMQRRTSGEIVEVPRMSLSDVSHRENSIPSELVTGHGGQGQVPRYSFGNRPGAGTSPSPRGAGTPESRHSELQV
ncbi:hypothetical protein DFS34DRAFT_624068 [Phlyctochytrium arcticum]|nr:hypothetical protein DFS34DRAFT_624068 [Phlyctochytrium arcticum]